MKAVQSVRAIIARTGAGLELVADGIETGSQLPELQPYGCDFIQGYYCHRPVEAADLIIVEGQLVSLRVNSQPQARLFSLPSRE